MFTDNWNVVSGEVATAVKFNQLGDNDDYLKDAVIKAVATGAVMAFAGSTTPTGWLLCDGSAVNRTTYADLFTVIGVTYGSGDGSTTFNLPDWRGRVIVGFDSTVTEFNALGKKSGERAVTLSTSQIPAHSHGVNDPGHSHGYHQSVQIVRPIYHGADSNHGFHDGHSFVGSEHKGTGIWLSNTGGSGSHNNIQPSMVANIIIKT